jgi:hypothetical protein
MMLINGVLIADGRHLLKGKPKRLHGESYSPEYRVWALMKQRCYDPTVVPYPRYGGRGIIVCDEWRDDFLAFLRDMGRRHSPEHTIERVDNDGNYEPSNCIWLLRSKQSGNQCTNVRITVDEKTMTVAEWGRFVGIPVTRLYDRLRLRNRRKGYTDEDVIRRALSGN